MKSKSPFSSGLAALAIALGLAFSLQAEPLKVAVVDMRVLLTEFHETKAAESEDAVERDDIKKDDTERISGIRALEAEMQKLGGSLQDPSLADAKRQEIAKGLATREQTYVALGRERKEFLSRRGRQLNQKMVTRMNDIRATISKQVQAYAQTIDVDYVFDGTGLTTSQVPFMLYIRNKVDITQDVLKLLNKNAPAE